MDNLETFTIACFEALEFTDFGPDSEFGDAELSDETKDDLRADCRSFWRRFGCYTLTDIVEEQGRFSCSPVEQAGHDFWMTRNGHGVGFWEDEWPECYRDLLTNGAKAYGEFTTYLGDDGMVYA